MLILCKRCEKVLLIEGDDAETNVLLGRSEWCQSFPCLTPLCRGRAARTNGPELAAYFRARVMRGDVSPAELAKHLTASEYYAALHGLGTSSDVAASFENVQKALFEQRIVAVTGQGSEPPHAPRTYIDSLTLADGTVLHMAQSSHGACVYRIEGGDSWKPRC